MIGKQAGLWIDHRKAVVVLITEGGEEIQTIPSGAEKRGFFIGRRPTEDSSKEDVRDRHFGLHLNRFYDQVVALLRQANSILIFGPGEAKNELQKRLERKGLKNRLLPLESADKMTDAQIAARVRERFLK